MKPLNVKQSEHVLFEAAKKYVNMGDIMSLTNAAVIYAHAKARARRSRDNWKLKHRGQSNGK